MTPAPRRRIVQAWLLLALAGPTAAQDAGTATTTPATPPASVSEATLGALLTDRRLAEISGMAASRRHPGVFWVHNDSGDEPVLHAIDRSGRLRASLQLDGVQHIDWEDIASYRHEGRDRLVIADTGDNGGLRDTVQLIVLDEPARLRDARVRPAWTVPVRWPDGPRDCEALAVDSASGTALLVSKKRVPPELFAVSLAPPADSRPRTATRLGTLAGIAQPSPDDLQRSPRFGRYRAQITAADLGPDGRTLLVLNYLTGHLYTRRDGEPWAKAVARPPVPLPYPWLAQAEAATFDPDGRAVWITTERLPAPLIRVPLPD